MNFEMRDVQIYVIYLRNSEELWSTRLSIREYKNQQQIQSIYNVRCRIRSRATLMGDRRSHHWPPPPPPLPPLPRNTELIHRIRGVPDRMQQRTLYVVSYPSRRVSRLCDDCSSSGLTRLKLIQFISAGLKDIHHVGSPRHSSERTSDRRECRRQLRLAPRQSSFGFGDVLLLIWNLLSQRL